MSDEDKFSGRMHGPQDEPKEKESLFMRLVYMILIAILLSFAQTVLTLLTVLQFILIILSGGKPNEAVADFGTTLGVWIAKAARFQTAASEVKPWPWSELD